MDWSVVLAGMSSHAETYGAKKEPASGPSATAAAEFQTLGTLAEQVAADQLDVYQSAREAESPSRCS